MFALFYSLFASMFVGTWHLSNLNEIESSVSNAFNALGEFLTSIFNNVDTPMTDLGYKLFLNPQGTWLALLSFFLALITSLGIVVMAVKGVKKAFGIFFMGIR